MLAHLCLASPAIVNGGWVGKKVGRNGEVINKYGDTVMNCSDIYHNTWCRRHDRIKQHVMSEAILSGVHVEFEVQFSDLLHQGGGRGIAVGKGSSGDSPRF